MGLDITAYKTATLVRAATLKQITDADYDVEGTTILYQMGCFEAQSDGLPGGVYRVSEEERDFRAGSYGGYNHWRSQLAELTGKRASAIHNDPAPVGPFVELINFSDCEGFIGPKTSAKLAKDFADWQDRADAHGDEYFAQRFADWRKAFELAAGAGVVKFH